jgi:acetyl-CoA carboxylase biotin carboxyl carrier protein
MNLDDIRKILELVREHELAEFELERNGLKIRVRKQAGESLTAATSSPEGGAALPPPPLTAKVPVMPALPEAESVELAVVKSPIVGTF